MFDEEKLKNDGMKRKNDESFGFEELIDSNPDEPDDRYPRRNSLSDSEVPGCGVFFSAAMQYPFDGNNALTKLAIAAVLAIIPFIGSLIVTGYGVRVVRRVLRGQRDLPEWNDFGGDFTRGLVMLFGGIIFGVLLSISMIAVVTIPIVMFLGFPMFAYVICRYAATDDISAFVDIFGAYKYVLSNLWSAIMVTLSVVLLGMVWGIAATIGFALFIIPGMILSAAATISFSYLIGAWGRTVGLDA